MCACDDKGRNRLRSNIILRETVGRPTLNFPPGMACFDPSFSRPSSGRSVGKRPAWNLSGCGPWRRKQRHGELILCPRVDRSLPTSGTVPLVSFCTSVPVPSITLGGSENRSVGGRWLLQYPPDTPKNAAARKMRPSKQNKSSSEDKFARVLISLKGDT